jgi:hypothetical protein
MYSIDSHGVEHHLYLSAHEIGHRRRSTAIRHMDHVDPGHHLEQLARDMAGGAVAARAHVDLAGIGLGVVDELGGRSGRNRWMDLHEQRRAHQDRDRRHVGDEAVAEIVVERGVDGIYGVGHQ